MNKLREKWNAIPLTRKLWVLLFVQIWTWPQLFFSKMEPNIGIPLGITMIVCIIGNVIKLVNAYDAGEY